VGAGPADCIREGEIETAVEYDLDLPCKDGWAMSLAISAELVRSLGAEIIEYDVTPSGGTISLRVPIPMNRTVRTFRALGRSERSLRASRAIIRRSRVVATRTAVLLGTR
jgi:hypothetical protein